MSNDKANSATSGVTATTAPSTASNSQTTLTLDDVRGDAQYDISQHIMPYLDRHLMVPIMDFLMSKELYDEASLRKTRYEVISQTKMIDAIIDDYERVFDRKADESFMQARSQVIKDIEATRAACGNLIHIIDRKVHETQQASAAAAALASANAGAAGANASASATKIEISPEDLGRETARPENVEALYAFGRLSYDIGSYRDAALALQLYRSLSRDDEKNLMALWGRVAALILERIPDVSDDLRQLRDALETRGRGATTQQTLTQRIWFLHWLIFQLTTAQTSAQRQLLADQLYDNRTLSMIQSGAPHLLRYVAVVAIIHAPHRYLREVARVIVQEQDTYSDPITQLLRNLYVEYDFAAASALLLECKKVFASDYFLQSPQLRDDFFDSALNLFMDVYSHLYKDVDLVQLRKMLHVDEIYVNRPVVSPAAATAAATPAPESAEGGDAAAASASTAQPEQPTLTLADTKFTALATKVGLVPKTQETPEAEPSTTTATPQQALLTSKAASIPSHTVAFHQLVRNRALAIGSRGTQLSQILDRRGAAAVAAAAAAASSTSRE